MGYSWGVETNGRPGVVRALWRPSRRADDDHERRRAWPLVAFVVIILAIIAALIGDGGGQSAPVGPYRSDTTPDARPSLRVTPMGRVPVVPVQIVGVGA